MFNILKRVVYYINFVRNLNRNSLSSHIYMIQEKGTTYILVYHFNFVFFVCFVNKLIECYSHAVIVLVRLDRFMRFTNVKEYMYLESASRFIYRSSCYPLSIYGIAENKSIC